MNYQAEQKLRHENRMLRSSIEWHTSRLEKANKLLSDHKIGPYKYTETEQDRFQKKIDLAGQRIKMSGEVAAERIRTIFCKHEAYEIKLYKRATVKKEKEGWFVVLHRFRTSIDTFGPFDTKKEAEQYIKNKHTTYVTMGTLFEEYKNQNKKDKNDKNIHTRNGITSI